MEIEVLKKLQHENLVNFKDMYLTKRNGCDILQVVMEYLNGGALCNMAEQIKLSEKCIAAIVHEVSFIHINIDRVNLLVNLLS